MIDFANKTELMWFIVLASLTLLFLLCNIFALRTIKKKGAKPFCITIYIFAWLTLAFTLAVSAFTFVVRMGNVEWLNATFMLVVVSRLVIEILVYVLAFSCVTALIVMPIKWKMKAGSLTDGDGYLTVGEEGKIVVKEQVVGQIVYSDGDQVVAFNDAIVDEAVVEDEPIVDEPVVEDEPIVEVEPVVEDEIVVEDESPVEELPVEEEQPTIEVANEEETATSNASKRERTKASVIFMEYLDGASEEERQKIKKSIRTVKIKKQ